MNVAHVIGNFGYYKAKKMHDKIDSHKKPHHRPSSTNTLYYNAHFTVPKLRYIWDDPKLKRKMFG